MSSPLPLSNFFFVTSVPLIFSIPVLWEKTKTNVELASKCDVIHGIPIISVTWNAAIDKRPRPKERENKRFWMTRVAWSPSSSLDHTLPKTCQLHYIRLEDRRSKSIWHHRPYLLSHSPKEDRQRQRVRRDEEPVTLVPIFGWWFTWSNVWH